jgi:DNA-binding MarR family transcriptional regulator
MVDPSAPHSDQARDRRRRGVQLTSRDGQLLEFLAEHRLALPDHIRALLGVTGSAVDARLSALASAGYLTREPLFHRQPWSIQITRKGLEAIGSALPAPRLDLRAYRHDVGVGWLWLAAHSEAFGPMQEVIGERRLRSHDASAEGSLRPLAVRLGGVGHGGRERLHYPDLLLVTPERKRIAVELELSPKGQQRWERILAGYAADPRVAVVLYMVENRALGRSIATIARRLGISDLVHVQMVRCTVGAPGSSLGRVAQRAGQARTSHSAPGACAVQETVLAQR